MNPECTLNSDGQCCCNCKNHLPVHYYCGHEPVFTREDREEARRTGKCICGIQKGWGCVVDGRVYDFWPMHSIGCELYTASKPALDPE